MSYIVIDLETTSTRDPARGLHPYGENVITHYGWKSYGCPTYAERNDEQNKGFNFGSSEEVVGFNLPFDLGFMLAKGDITPEDIPPVTWDCAIFDYLWFGQLKFQSLNQVAERWLGMDPANQKNADIGDLIAEYGDTDKIPDEEIIPYLTQDVELTERLYLAQRTALESATEARVFLIASEFAACRENIIATHRGIPLDMKRVQDEQQTLEVLCDAVTNMFRNGLERLAGPDFIPDNLINSTTFCQQLLYQPTILISGKELAGEYKSGLKKGQKKYKSNVRPVSLPNPMDTLEGTSTDETALDRYQQQYLTTTPDPHNRNYFINLIQMFRSAQKSLTTYCGNLIKYQVQGVLHPQYQQTATGTGRISSSKPNIQNQP